MTHSTSRSSALAVVAALAVAGCGASDGASSTTAATVADVATPTIAINVTENDVESGPATDSVEATEVAEEESSDAVVVAASTYEIEVWADNWSAVYIDGVLVGEDSVAITTERSFNAETFTFEASPPFTIAIEAKDFKETDSGIEYIGEPNQQMGDGGIIAQVTDLATGEIVAATGADWSTLVVHRAPLNTECETDPDPDSTCEFSIVETPSDWTAVDFDDSTWANATEWSAEAVSPKDGYDEIDWDLSAQLIWGTDLEIDNTILLRTTVS